MLLQLIVVENSGADLLKLRKYRCKSNGKGQKVKKLRLRNLCSIIKMSKEVLV